MFRAKKNTVKLHLIASHLIQSTPQIFNEISLTFYMANNIINNINRLPHLFILTALAEPRNETENFTTRAPSQPYPIKICLHITIT